jgi:hypothetical protein
MRDTQRKLFEFLRACETSRRTFTLGQAAEASGLSVVSVRTYVSKKLEGRWVEATDGQHYKVHGVLKISSRDFEHAMSQKADSVFGGPDVWRAQMRNLLQLGVDSGYPVATIVSDLMNEFGAASVRPRGVPTRRQSGAA